MGGWRHFAPWNRSADVSAQRRLVGTSAEWRSISDRGIRPCAHLASVLHPTKTGKERTRMRASANTPEDICHLFRQYMREGDIDSVLSVYDPDVVFVNRERIPRFGLDELRQELAPFAAAKTSFDFTNEQIIEAGDVALMHTKWRVAGPEPLSVYAIEVARRQPDGTWRWLIGDPFTVGK